MGDPAGHLDEERDYYGLPWITMDSNKNDGGGSFTHGGSMLLALGQHTPAHALRRRHSAPELAHAVLGAGHGSSPRVWLQHFAHQRRRHAVHRRLRLGAGTPGAPAISM